MIASRTPGRTPAARVEPERLAVAMGTGIGGVWTLLDQWDNLREKGPRRVFPLAVPMLTANGPSADGLARPRCPRRRATHRLRLRLRRRGDGLRPEMIRSGRADVVVAGGTEAAVHPLPFAGFAAMQALSKRNDEPDEGLTPLRHGPRRLRPRRGRRGDRPRERGAREGPRRADLRRPRRYRDVRRLAPSPRPSRRAPARPAPWWRRSSRPASRRPTSSTSTPRDVDPGRRRGRGQRHPAGVRRGPPAVCR